MLWSLNLKIAFLLRIITSVGTKFAGAKSREYSGWTRDITSLRIIKISKLCNECLLCVTERILFDCEFHELPQSTLRMTVNASASKEYINFSFYFDKNFVCEHILKILLSYLVCTTKLLTSNRYAQNWRLTLINYLFMISKRRTNFA